MAMQPNRQAPGSPDPFAKKDDGDEEKKPKKPQLFSQIKPVAFLVAFVYIASISFVLSYTYRAGKYSEYGIPLYLLETHWPTFLLIFCALCLAAISALTALLLSLEAGHEVEERSKKVTDFFAAVTSIAVAVYLSLVCYRLLILGRFSLEIIYVAVIYSGALFFYFQSGKSRLMHFMVSAAFMVTLLVATFSTGRSVVRVEDKMITRIESSVFCLTTTYRDNLILSGYKPGLNLFSGEMLIVKQSARKDMIFAHINPK